MSTEIRRWPTQTRVVTILFVDLSGSSAHLNATDAETHLTAVQSFVSIVRQNVERRGGHVIQYLGDGAMCFFGDDHGSEFAHATLAVQLQAQTGQLSGASEPYALFFAFAEVFDPVTSPVAQAWPEFVAPASPSFRSLPPAGRAPPLHA